MPQNKHVTLWACNLTLLSFQSRKLHSFSGLANTIGVISRMIFARSFCVMVVYHLDSRTFPCRLSNSTNLICTDDAGHESA